MHEANGGRKKPDGRKTQSRDRRDFFKAVWMKCVFDNEELVTNKVMEIVEILFPGVRRP